MDQRSGTPTDPSQPCTLHEYDGILHHFLEMIQRENSELFAADDDVQANHGFFRTFRKMAKAKARDTGLDSNVQTAMNRWRTIENAKGGHPRFNMIKHYSNAQDLMPVTWRYLYVQ